MQERNGRSDRANPQPPAELLQAMAAHASTARYVRGQSVYQAGDRADRWYRIFAGVAARCSDLSDGRRQILELLLPGDFFGFSASAEHLHGVEVVTGDTEITSYSRHSLEALAATDPKLERGLRELAFAAIRRLDDRVVTVGRLSATEKVGAFLMEMAERSPGDSRERIELPMSRFEIADYLGLSMETVSRSIGQLRRKAAIALSGPHRVKVLNRSILKADETDPFDAPSGAQSRGVNPSRKA
jgi:CRP-like cAMP-binding protein